MPQLFFIIVFPDRLQNHNDGHMEKVLLVITFHYLILLSNILFSFGYPLYTVQSPLLRIKFKIADSVGRMHSLKKNSLRNLTVPLHIEETGPTDVKIHS